MPPRFTFKQLVDAYPHENKGITGSCLMHANKCAMRMSFALAKVGMKLPATYEGKKCQSGNMILAQGAQHLAKFLYHNYKYPFEYEPSEARKKVVLRKGIIFFRNIDKSITDHIDLWDGFQTLSGEYFERCSRVLFWPVN